MQKFIFGWFAITFSLSALAGTSIFGNWNGTLIKSNVGYACSPSDLAITNDGSHLYIKLSAGCSISPMTKVFAIKEGGLFLGTENVGTISADEISIVKRPGPFGGPIFILQIEMKNTELSYLESVEGSSHDYAISGKFVLTK